MLGGLPGRRRGAGACAREPGIARRPASAWFPIAEHDPLLDDGLDYARALAEAGVDVQTVVYDDMTHGFLRWGGIVARSQEAIAVLGDAARAALA